MTLYAKKGNVQIRAADEAEAKALAGQGYDILDGDGGMIMPAAGKKVSYEQYAQLEAAHKELVEKYEQLEAGKKPPPSK